MSANRSGRRATTVTTTITPQTHSIPQPEPKSHPQPQPEIQVQRETQAESEEAWYACHHNNDYNDIKQHQITFSTYRDSLVFQSTAHTNHDDDKKRRETHDTPQSCRTITGSITPTPNTPIPTSDPTHTSTLRTTCTIHAVFAIRGEQASY